jgi:Ca2+-transporting ATPase
MSNIALILTNRSWEHTIIGTFRKHNNAFWWILVIALAALALVIYVPPFTALFHFSALDPVNLLICLGAGLVSIVWFELYKAIKKVMGKS